MLKINLQFFGGRGSGGGKGGGGGAGGSGQALNQSQMAAKISDLKYSAHSMTVSERESVMANIAKQAAPGTSISVDNRVLSGFRGSSSGTAYEFRKLSNGNWEEIFGDYNTISSTQLANMYVNSRGFKRSIS